MNNVDKTERAYRISHEYFDRLTKEKLAEAIRITIEGDDTIIGVNGVLRIFKLHDLDLANGHVMSRVIEKYLAKAMHKIFKEYDFIFEHGSENSQDKDIVCVKKPDDFFIETVENDPKYFSIELKTRLWEYKSSIAGNKSYKEGSKNQQKDRNAFYIYIAYELPKITDDYAVKRYKAYFTFINQEDWGNVHDGSSSATVTISKFKTASGESRLIEII
jgi:hypothetical protein